jgi:hypothetical protein
MMPASYQSLDGKVLEIDLDAVVDVVDGWSQIKSGWQGFIVYSAAEDRFIELMSAVPDVRGNSDSQSVEVQADYVETVYGLSSAQLSELRRAPSRWTFIKKR